MIEHFFETVPGIIVAIAGIVGGAVVGGLYVVSVIKGKKDNADDRLINILKTTVDELEDKVDKQAKDIEELTNEVKKLRTDNETYLEILRGRDEQTQMFYKEGFKAMKEASEILLIVKDVQTTIHDKNESVNKLIETVNNNAKVVLEAAKLQTK